MGNYENLKQSITEVIRTNGNQEITGSILQNVLLTIISTVGANATFAGIATPTTNPGTPDGPVFYLASESGTYTNFNAIELQDGLSVLSWNGSWSSQQIFGVDDVPTAGSDNPVKSGGVQEELALGAVYDVSAKNPTAGVNNDGKFESLSALLGDTNLDTLIPVSVRKGGMSIKFVQSSDNNYIQFRCKANAFTIDTAEWVFEGDNVLVENPEFIEAKTDNEGRLLESRKHDGTKVEYCDLEVKGKILNDEIKDKVDKEEGKSLISADFAERVQYVDNSEFIDAKVDNNDKLLEATRNDGTKVFGGDVEVNGGISSKRILLGGVDISGAATIDTLSIIEDPENRIELTTDVEDKIVSYRDSDGTLVENVGVKTNSLKLTEEGMTEFQQALKDSGFNPGGTGDWTDSKELAIPHPRCVLVNIYNPNGNTIWPTSKAGRPDYNPGVNAELPYIMEFWDMSGNYFKKEILFSAQGNSSMLFEKLNGAVDICNNNGWDDDDTFKLKIGNWVTQDSFHLKSYYTDYIRGAAVVSYQIADEVYKTRGQASDRPWKKGLIDYNNISSVTPTMMSEDGPSDLSLQIDNGARCMPDGFPAIVYLDGEFYGIYSWQLKKHRDNYNMNKNTAEHIHLDGDLYMNNIWNGSINWTSFEIRNPKSLYCMDGSKYDGDDPAELIDSTSPYYDSTNKNHKRSAKVKQYIINLSNRIGEINTLNPTDREAAKALFDTYFDADNLIDYQLINMAIGDTDGFGKNWQWITYDGIKWFVCQYDKDMSFGNHFTGMYTTPPINGWLSDSRNLPSGLAIRYYEADFKTRWNELVALGIFTKENIQNKITEWIYRIGQENFEKEWEKWPNSPCNRDSKIDFENWIFTGECQFYTAPTEDLWNNNTQYHINDEVWYGNYDYSNFNWKKFKAVKDNINKPCLTETYSLYPQTMGYRDSIWRYFKYIEETLTGQNTFINSL